MRHDETGHPWNEFWRLAKGDAGCIEAAQGKPLADFWQALFARCLARGTPRRLVDLAAGSGPVSRQAHDIAASIRCPLSAVAVDLSLRALQSLQASVPAGTAVVADVRKTPFADRSFDIVASQFGLEYGGADAFEEAARLMASPGTLGAIIHLKGGAIHRENAANLQAIEVVRRSALFQATGEYFKAELEWRRGTRTKRVLREAQERFGSALGEVARELRESGSEVAGGTVRRMYEDVTHLGSRPSAFDPPEVLAWLDRMSAEADAYAGRMSSMIAAALDEADLGAIRDRLAARGVRMCSTSRLAAPRNLGFMAWAAVFER